VAWWEFGGKMGDSVNVIFLGKRKEEGINGVISGGMDEVDGINSSRLNGGGFVRHSDRLLNAATPVSLPANTFPSSQSGGIHQPPFLEGISAGG
jgi:hypothetical protein